MKSVSENFDREQIFILEALRGLVHKDRFAALYPEEEFIHLNWPRIIKISTEQRVMGFVSHAAHELGCFPALSPDIQETLENALLEYSFLNGQRKIQFKELSVLFGREGINVLPLKGIYLSFFIYSDLPYRSMSDLDVLIPEKHIEKAVKVLENEGFKQAFFLFGHRRYRWHDEINLEISLKDKSYLKRLGRNSYVNNSRLMIDIHWEPNYIIGHEKITFDHDYFWQSVAPDKKYGENVYMPLAQRHLLFLAAHTVDQYTSSLVQIYDIALSMNKLPGAIDFLENETKAWPVIASQRLLVSCRTAQDIFLSDIPIAKLSLEARDLLMDFFNLKTKRDRGDPYIPVLTVSQKIKFLAGFLVPEPSFYREKNKLVMYARHWSFVIKRVFSVLFHILTFQDSGI